VLARLHKVGRGVAKARRNGWRPLSSWAAPVRPARTFPAATNAALLAHGGTGGLLVELGILLAVLALAAAAWVGGRRERAEREREQAGRSVKGQSK
jgi:hypothetical protein